MDVNSIHHSYFIFHVESSRTLFFDNMYVSVLNERVHFVDMELGILC